MPPEGVVEALSVTEKEFERDTVEDSAERDGVAVTGRDSVAVAASVSVAVTGSVIVSETEVETDGDSVRVPPE